MHKLKYTSKVFRDEKYIAHSTELTHLQSIIRSQIMAGTLFVYSPSSHTLSESCMTHMLVPFPFVCFYFAFWFFYVCKCQLFFLFLSFFQFLRSHTRYISLIKYQVLCIFFYLLITVLYL